MAVKRLGLGGCQNEQLRFEAESILLCKEVDLPNPERVSGCPMRMGRADCVGVAGPCGHHGRVRLTQGAPGASYRLDGDCSTPGRPATRAYKQAEHAVPAQPNGPFSDAFRGPACAE